MEEEDRGFVCDRKREALAYEGRKQEQEEQTARFGGRRLRRKRRRRRGFICD